MSQVLARLRMDLDFMPSPVEDRPGLFIRDPFQYSGSQLIIPPQMIPLLEFFDGNNTDLDLRQALVEATGRFDIGDMVTGLSDALSQAGFLEDEVFEEMRVARHREFAEAPLRDAAHAGAAYPDTAEELRKEFGAYFQGEGEGAERGLVGIAAPHVSPAGGWESYRDAYRALGPEHADKVFVVLGTSHYGEPEKFGLTRKGFLTPYGTARTEKSLVDRLERDGGAAVQMEDYCHSSEHSIEFQVAFLQHIYGPDVKILPILCGPFARSLYQGGRPEDDEEVKRFFGALAEMHAAESARLMWVLGVDMAHMGSRYHDSLPALAHDGHMLAVSARDKERIAQMEAGDARGFWDLVQPNHDDLKWCGSSPIYTFLQAVPQARGRMRRYQHWQIDPQSVVSFAAMTFTSA